MKKTDFHFNRELLGSDMFLSEEDLDLRNLSDEEFDRLYYEWLKQAQATNDEDADRYSHGVLIYDREPRSKKQKSPGRPGL